MPTSPGKTMPTLMYLIACEVLDGKLSLDAVPPVLRPDVEEIIVRLTGKEIEEWLDLQSED